MNCLNRGLTRINKKTGVSLAKNDPKFETNFCNTIPINNDIKFLDNEKNNYENLINNNKSTSELNYVNTKQSPDIYYNVLKKDGHVSSNNKKIVENCY